MRQIAGRLRNEYNRLPLPNVTKLSDIDAGISVNHILPDSTFTCFVIPSLFTQAECEGLLTTAIKTSFQKAHSNYPTYYLTSYIVL